MHDEGILIVIQDQDCDPQRLCRLEEDARRAIIGISADALLGVVCAVSIECTENWLLCHTWPLSHPGCEDLTHPSVLRCVDDKNRAKAIFDKVYGGGPAPRRQVARHITRHPQSSATSTTRG